jgi:hypothetical protein
MGALPGHENVEGNEAADVAAKEAIYNEIDQQENWSKTRTKRLIQATANANWQLHWNLGIKGREAHEAFPKIQHSLAYADRPEVKAQDGVLLRRAATGHFPCNAYLARFKLRESAQCRFCSCEKETIEHLIKKCPRFDFMKFEYAIKNNLDVQNALRNIFFQNRHFLELTIKILKITMAAAQANK